MRSARTRSVQKLGAHEDPDYSMQPASSRWQVLINLGLSRLGQEKVCDLPIPFYHRLMPNQPRIAGENFLQCCVR